MTRQPFGRRGSGWVFILTVLLMMLPALAVLAQDQPVTDAEKTQATQRVTYLQRMLAQKQTELRTWDNAIKMLTETPTRPASLGTLPYVEASRAKLQAWMLVTQQEIDAWQALAQGDRATFDKLMAVVRVAGQAQVPPEPINAKKLAAVTDQIVNGKAAAMIEHARQLVRYRGLEDRLSVISRAVYHIRNLSGGYIPNEQFQQQFGSLYGGQIKFDAQTADPATAMQQVVDQCQPLIGLAMRQLAHAKELYIDYLQAAQDNPDAVTQIATLVLQAQGDLDEAEKIMNPTLGQLGYDIRQENRRPITFDKQFDPSDVIISLDERAGDFIDVLEGDQSWKVPPVLLIGHGTSGAFVNSTLFKEAQKAMGDRGEELMAMSAAGVRSRSLVNFWHPKVRELLKQYFTQIGEEYAKDKSFLFYDRVTWEPNATLPATPSARDRDDRFFGYATENGRSPEAVTAFQDWLKNKFGSIEKLNAAWGSKYAGFDAIQPPPDPYQERRVRPTPLTQEHELFRRESTADHIGLAVASLMAADPSRPVRHEIPGMMNYSIETPFSTWDLMTRVPAKFTEMHKNDFWPALPALVYNGTIAPMYDRIPVHTEFIWTWGRRSEPVNESQFYHQGLQSFWRNAAYGARALSPFAHFNWIGYENGYMDIMANRRFGTTANGTGFVLRDSAPAIPISGRRLRHLGNYFKTTSLAPREVMVLQPSTTTINPYPYFSIAWSFNVHVQESKNFHDLLFNRNYQYGYLLEESLFDGKAKLEDYPVVILPYAVALADGMNEKLLAYVEQGGTIIASGAPGLYDKYGRDDMTFLKTIFGDISVEYAGDHFVWKHRIKINQPNERTTILLGDKDDVHLVETTYGKGKVLVSNVPFMQRAEASRMVPYFYLAVNQALGGKRVDLMYDRFEVAHRIDGRGGDYLFILNPSLDSELEDRVTVRGEFKQAFDLGIGAKFAVPLLGHEAASTLKMPVDHGVQFLDNAAPAGHSSFWLRLEPSQGTIIRLVK